jgi:hypothetical protein
MHKRHVMAVFIDIINFSILDLIIYLFLDIKIKENRLFR